MSSVHVGNIPPGCTINELPNLFARLGPIREVRIERDGKYAFVDFCGRQPNWWLSQSVRMSEENGAGGASDVSGVTCFVVGRARCRSSPLIMSHQGGRLAQYNAHDAADAALSLDRAVLGGVELRVEIAKVRKPCCSNDVVPYFKREAATLCIDSARLPAGNSIRANQRSCGRSTPARA